MSDQRKAKESSSWSSLKRASTGEREKMAGYAISRLIRSKRGVATSLLEATATIAIGATLAAAAITVVSDKVQQARIAQAINDVRSIADAMNAFENDNGLYPIFKSAGTNTAAILATNPNPLTNPEAEGRSNVDLLESENGDEPEVASSSLNDHADDFDSTGHPADGTGGHAKAGTTPGWDSGNFDTIENQLSLNGPGYALRGEITFDEKLGYNGPYMAAVPPTDPWGNKFKINALYLDDHRVSDGKTNRFQTFVLSAGPNEKIQTAFEIKTDAIGLTDKKIEGDDIGFRVR